MTGPTAHNNPRPGTVPGGRGLAGFDDEAAAKLQAARLWILVNRPYYSRALLACPLIPTTDRPTMSIAMDRRWRIYVNPGYVTDRSVERVAVSLIHEINHALRDHHQRGHRTASAELFDYWKVACDLEINDDLEDDGLDVEDLLLPDHFGLEPYQSAESYYRQLTHTTPDIDGVPQCGPVCSLHPHHGHLDPRGEQGLSDVERWVIQHATAVLIAPQHHNNNDVDGLDYYRGGWDVPAGLRAWAEHTTAAKADWRQLLARTLRQAVHSGTGASDYTWQRPPRRHDPDDPILRPALASPTPEVTIVLDTSSSMNQQDHTQAFGEIDAILRTAVPGTALTVLSVDHEVQNTQRVQQASRITPVGGRGTDMAAGIEAAAHTRPDAIVVLTDGGTDWPPTPPPGAGCVIAALTQNDWLHRVPRWIRTIDISPDP